MRMAMTEPTTTVTAPLLDYAEPPPWHRRRRVRRTVVLTAAFVAVTGFAWCAGPALWRHAVYLRAYSRCLNYAPPADRVVYEEDPQQVESLLASRSPTYRRVVYRGTLAGTDWNPVALNTDVTDGFAQFTCQQVDPPLLFL